MDANPNSLGGRDAKLELSPRELECLCWVSQGKSSTDIGSILGLSARTVDSYLEKAASKLGVRTRIEAVAVGVRRGLIEID
ncbi:response regulator transcription factor [Brevundimonas faecalis]|uniref:DNA-binding CsgD family transcriptional regulator n=1 Tax=Brevundimonas faecalis TaxID=947378 RepID=A0ABV2R9Q7_9CAUL